LKVFFSFAEIFATHKFSILHRLRNLEQKPCKFVLIQMSISSAAAACCLYISSAHFPRFLFTWRLARSSNKIMKTLRSANRLMEAKQQSAVGEMLAWWRNRALQFQLQVSHAIKSSVSISRIKTFNSSNDVNKKQRECLCNEYQAMKFSYIYV